MCVYVGLNFIIWSAFGNNLVLCFGVLLQEDTSLICIEKGDDQALAHDDKQPKSPFPTSVEEKENTSHTANQ